MTDVQPVAPSLRLVTLPEGVPDYTLGFEAIRWATRWLTQPNGPRAGHRFEFVESQARFLLWFYALDDDGNWLYRHAVRRLAKSSGKSPFAAALCLIELCASVRFAGFDSDAPGGVIGQPVALPWVQIGGTTEANTSNIMRMVRAFAPKGSRVVNAHHLDPGLTRYFTPEGGKLEVLSSSSRSVEGAEASFIACDETQEWNPRNGGTAFFQTLADNAAKSGSRMIEVSNAWVPGTESVAETSYQAWVQQEEGRTRGRMQMLYDARIAPPDTDLADETSLMSGLRFVYDDCYWTTRNLDAVRERVWDVSADPAEARRKYLNWPSVSSRSWTTPEAWAKLADPARTVPDGTEIVAFFDGSRSRDATALIGCTVDDGHVFTLGVWEPENTDHGDTGVQVPVTQVDDAVAAMFDRYTVLGFFADVAEWQSFALVTWPERYSERLLVWAAPSAKQPTPIGWDMRTRTYDFTGAAETTLAELEQGKFTHDGDARVARHVANARRHANRWGTSIGKQTKESPYKIDAAVCVIGARMVRRMLLGSKAYRNRRPTDSRVLVFR